MASGVRWISLTLLALGEGFHSVEPRWKLFGWIYKLIRSWECGGRHCEWKSRLLHNWAIKTIFNANFYFNDLDWNAFATKSFEAAAAKIGLRGAMNHFKAEGQTLFRDEKQRSARNRWKLSNLSVSGNIFLRFKHHQHLNNIWNILKIEAAGFLVLLLLLSTRLTTEKRASAKPDGNFVDNSRERFDKVHNYSPLSLAIDERTLLLINFSSAGTVNWNKLLESSEVDGDVFMTVK